MPSDFENALDALEVVEELSYKTKGRSMEPLFKEHRDIINIRRIKAPLKRGDVILYPDKAGMFLILHRVINTDGDNLLIRGDNNYFDEHRKTDEVIGVMTSFFREGRYCDISKSKWYKVYSFWILNSYGLRKFFRNHIRPRLAKIKHLIIKPSED